MDSQFLEPDILFASLPAEPRFGPELLRIRHGVAQTENAHLVLDLSRVEMVTSPNIGNLLVLKKVLSQGQRRLILCGVSLATRCILRVAGLDDFFEFAEDKLSAVRLLHRPPEIRADITN